MLRLAIQKSGRLSESSLEIIKKCGIKIANVGKGRLRASATNFPIELLYLRDDDIPGYVADGVADIGIVGQNEVSEKDQQVDEVMPLGFSKCRLSIAVPKHVDYHGYEWLQNKRIATSYPVILQNWLNENNIDAEPHEISGSVEIAPGIGLADAICDLVSSGSTLLSNGLKEAEKIFYSQATLIAHPELNDAKSELLDKLLFRIKSIQTADNNKYILLNAPKENVEQIRAILPGMRSPTLVPLAEEGWVSMHSVINENEFWDKIDDLKAAGAQGILVVPIEKMIL